MRAISVDEGGIEPDVHIDCERFVVKALIVHAHPDRSSFNRALLDRTVSGLESAGHSYDIIDLYALDYRAEMSRDEHIAYSSPTPIIDPVVAEHARLVSSCDILIFIYPTWWSSLPAILKGWLDRTLVVGVAFDLDTETGRLTPLLGNIRHLIGITTHGSPWWYVKVVNDNGRRMILRAVRATINWRSKTTWLAMYDLDSRSDEDRRRFLGRVENTMSQLKVFS